MKNNWRSMFLERSKFRPYPVLVRHFFHRLFQNDFVAFEDQMKEKTISILAIIAVFSAHVANSVLMKYMFVEDNGISWLEKCFFASFIMLILGFITVFEWDVLFPDSRDFSNLMVLPIRLRTIFAAKFASLCGFVALFAFGANILASFPFWFYLPKWQAEADLLFFTGFLFVHLICMFAASFFVFFMAVFLIGILMMILPERLFRAISLMIRTILMISFVFVMILVVSTSITGSQTFRYLEGLKLAQSPLFYLFPPVWFTGLYETLLGNDDPQFRTASFFALLSLVIVTAGFFITSALVYRKYCRNVEVKRKTNQNLLRLRYHFIRVFNSVALHDPIQRGIFYFFWETLKKSMLHKMRLATFIAVGFALGLIPLVVYVDHPAFFLEPNRTLLSFPLILIFFLLIGMRSVVNIPARLDANWIFRMTENKNLRSYAAGLRKGIIFLLLLPFSALVLASFSFLWGWALGALQGIFVFVMSVLLMEILFLNHNKIPFACAYLPGQAKAHILWPAYILSFFAFVGLSMNMEWALLRKPIFFFFFLCAGFAVIKAVRIYHARLLHKKTTLTYVDEPEPALVTLLTYSHK
jgi:hypothetical protein